jgi:arginyl-tRNA synthetase
MKTVIELITEELQEAFTKAGVDTSYAKVNISNRPDLCEYQCNGAMAAAKALKKAPFMIADDVVANLTDNKMFSKVESVKPGFINMTVSPEFITDYINEMAKTDKFGYVNKEGNKTVIVDYGGANAAKPLHVGHLRSAVIGESVKRINNYVGNRQVRRRLCEYIYNKKLQ